MCLCGNLGLLKESGQYSTLAPKQPMLALKTMPFVTNLQDEDPFTLIVNVNVVMLLAEI